MLDFITHYFPERIDIPSERIQDTRLRIVNYMRRERPDQDMRPNTPFGDLFITPAAEYLTALEIAAERFQSDLDIEAIAGGTIWYCDFVEKYLKSFAAVPSTSLPATGVVRLTFNKDAECEIDQSIRFSFIADNVAQFSMRLPHDGPLIVKPVAAPLDGRQNQWQLVQTGVDTYAVDIPVEGSMSEPVTEGLTGRISQPVECLTSVVSVIDFNDGVPEDSLPRIAERTREAFHAMTLSSRNGAISWITRQFPDVEAVSPVMAGDEEMVRDSFNPLGLHTGGMDIHVRSSHARTTFTQRIPLFYYETQEGQNTDVFAGKFETLHNPHRIESVSWAGGPTVDLGELGDGVIFYSRSRSPEIAPGLLCAFSPLEELYVAIKMPRTSGNAPMVTTTLDGAGRAMAWFDITYVADPMLQTVYDHVTSEDEAPTGSRIHVRGYNLLSFDSLTVKYRRRAGTSVNFSKAEAEIVGFINSRGGPTRPYSDGPIIDSMHYSGVSQVISIESEASVLWTAAQRFLPPDATLPDINANTALSESVLPYEIFASSSSGFTPVWKDPNLGTSTSLHASIGPRNTAYLLMDGDVVFQEV